MKIIFTLFSIKVLKATNMFQFYAQFKHSRGNV